jgi:hypothetical protein
MQTGISELKTNTENGVKITENDRDKAEVLVEFFSSVFTKEPEGEIPNLQSLVFRVKFVDPLSFFLFGHCIVCLFRSSIYGFWLSL